MKIIPALARGESIDLGASVFNPVWWFIVVIGILFLVEGYRGTEERTES